MIFSTTALPVSAVTIGGIPKAPAAADSASIATVFSIEDFAGVESGIVFLMLFTTDCCGRSGVC